MSDTQVTVNLGWRFDRIFVRNIDLKLHDAPEVFDMKWQPNVDLNFKNSYKEIGENRFQVALHLTITCRNLSKTVVEMSFEQAALVRLKAGYDASEVQRILAVETTNALFPYARETVDALALRMSIPPFMLAHFDFEKIFEESLTQLNLQQSQVTGGRPPSGDEIMN